MSFFIKYVILLIGWKQQNLFIKVKKSTSNLKLKSAVTRDKPYTYCWNNWINYTVFVWWHKTCDKMIHESWRHIMVTSDSTRCWITTIISIIHHHPLHLCTQEVAYTRNDMTQDPHLPVCVRCMCLYLGRDSVIFLPILWVKFKLQSFMRMCMSRVNFLLFICFTNKRGYDLFYY